MQKPKQYTLQDFNVGLERFMWLAICYIVLIVIMNFVARHYVFRWRTAITYNYLPRWKKVPTKIEGESQRMQEDPAEFANILESLGIKAVNAIMTLIAFVPVLWQLSKNIDLNSRHLLDTSTLWASLILWLIAPLVLNYHWKMTVRTSLRLNFRDYSFIFAIIFTIVGGYYFLRFLWTFGEFPGSLVWTALVVSIGGMGITWGVAYWLPRLEYNNQVVEAAFRKELVLAEEDKLNHSDLITLFGLFTGVKFNYYRLYLHYGYVDLWLHMYNQTMVVLPYIVAGPSLMAEIATLGVVVQVANAFGEVRSSLAVIIDNWTRVTRVRSIWRRLHEFEANMDKYTVSET